MRRLTARQLEDVARVQRVILSSDAFSDPNDWMREVNTEIRSLLRCEYATFMLPTPARSLIETNVPFDSWRKYFHEYAAVDPAMPMLEQLGRPFALQEDTQQSPLYSSYVNGAAFNEWYKPNGHDGAISIRAYGQPSVSSDFGPRWTSTMIGNILLGSAEMAAGKDSPIARTMLTLIHPPFEAAVRSVQQRITLGALNIAGDLSPTLESLDRPFWFFTGDGRCIHQSFAASELVGRLGDGAVLEAAAKRYARMLITAIRKEDPVGTVWTIDVCGERLRLAGGILRDNGPDSPVVIVRAEGVLPLLPTEAVLQTARGFTPQEARIAILLAMGATPAMIAERLSVSIHTVRRHTEGILAKLHANRTAEIAPRLLEIRAENPPRRPRD
jgi:DNA-binding CsgD family transcriptional regulator